MRVINQNEWGSKGCYLNATCLSLDHAYELCLLSYVGIVGWEGDMKLGFAPL